MDSKGKTVILPDVNLLIYAYNEDAPHHAAAKSWWEDLLTHGRPVRIPWAVVFGFVRLKFQMAFKEM
jgi:uncharacterized protein